MGSYYAPKYRLDLSEEQLVLIIAMLGVALEDTPGNSQPAHSEEIRQVMRSLAGLLVTMDMPKELREVLSPALATLDLSLVGGHAAACPTNRATRTLASAD
jgi:hypothetical protein